MTEDQHDLSDIKLLLIICIKTILSSWLRFKEMILMPLAFNLK